MKLDPERINPLIDELELRDEATRIRNHFRESILENSSFAEQLDLALGREKYLEDLGIVAEVDETLRRALADKLAGLKIDNEAQDKALAIRNAMSLNEDRFMRLMKRFDLDAHDLVACLDDSNRGDA